MGLRGDEGLTEEGARTDVVGLPLAEALQRLRDRACDLAFTAPVHPKGEAGVVRVIARRLEGGRVKLICAREYFDRPSEQARADHGAEPGD